MKGLSSSFYARNIKGCILEYQDYSGAIEWLKRAVRECKADKFEEILELTFDNILLNNRIDLADNLFEKLPSWCHFAGYKLLRKKHLKRIQDEKERKQRAEERRILDQQKREYIKEKMQRREAKKKQVLLELRKTMVKDFLAVHERYRDSWKEYLSENDFQKELKKFVKEWFKNHLPVATSEKSFFIPNDEQALAIATGRYDTLVVARAGSGKTATIVYRAFFLQKHCGVNPQEMLLLAFNRKAAEEMEERLVNLTGMAWPNVMTFHALAWAIVRPKDDILVNDDGEERLYRFVQKIIDDQLIKPDIMREIRKLMLARWRSDWERIEAGGYDKTGSEFLRYRRSLHRETLRGDYVRSYAEKVIANFLFEHDIKYHYRRPHRWDNRIYCPDFTLPRDGGKGGIIIECFGLKDDLNYDAWPKEKKSYWQMRLYWTLVEVDPKDTKRVDFEDVFCDRLNRLGVICNRLSEDEIWERARKRAIDRFTKAITGFILRARKLSLNLDKLEHIVSSHECEEMSVEKMFLGQAVPLYGIYLDRLKQSGKDDFDGLMARAVLCVSEGSTYFIRKSRQGDLAKMQFIFIDEYQDFTKLFFDLISKIKNNNSSVRLFCVGDDWQAINGFAGSDLSFFYKFERNFPDSIRINLSINYRSCSSIVEISNSLMSKMAGPPARVSRKGKGHVCLVDISRYIPTDHERKIMGSNETAALFRIVCDALNPSSTVFGDYINHDSESEVVILSRTNYLPWALQLMDFKKLIRKQLAKNRQDRISISTTHKYKGLQGRLVVIIDAMEGRYPLIHPDWVLMRVLGDTIQKVIEEERRLFYVAMTRAKDALVIVTDGSAPSPFLEELDLEEKMIWNVSTKAPADDGRIILMVGNADGRGISPTLTIKHKLKADAFSFVSGEWPCWCKTFDAKAFDIMRFWNGCVWADLADGVEIRICTENDEIRERYLVQQGSLQLLH